MAPEASFITSAVATTPGGRKRKPVEVPDGACSPTKHSPSPSMLSSDTGANLVADTAHKSIRAPLVTPPVTIPSAVLTRRASVDRGSTPIDALFSPNYHTPATDPDQEPDSIPAATTWAGEGTSSRRSSLSSSGTHAADDKASRTDHESPSGRGSFPPAIAEDVDEDEMDMGGSIGDSVKARRPIARGNSLADLTAPALSSSSSVSVSSTTTTAVIIGREEGVSGEIIRAHTSAVAKFFSMAHVSDLVAAARKTAEAAIQAEFDPFLFIKHLPPLEVARPHLLPGKSTSCPPMTLVLDLDETLVHCSTMQVANPDRVFQVSLNGQDYNVYMMQRPFLFEFLERVSQLFEVVVFTASQEIYADKLLDLIDKDRRWIKHRLFRDSCVFVQGNYLKDLTVLGRDMSQAVIVDNSPQAFGYQLWNGLPIESWYDDRDDRELIKVLAFLESLIGVEDVRPILRDVFRLHEYIP